MRWARATWIVAVATVCITAGCIVSANPLDDTPRVDLGSAMSGRTVYGIEQIGQTMYAGGSFQTVEDPSGQESYARSNLFAFDAISGDVSGAFRPDPDGTVESLVRSPDSKYLYIGGSFSTIGGVARSGLARWDIARRRVDPGFDAKLDGVVYDMSVARGRLFIGGTFTGALRAVDLGTGSDTGFANLAIAGKIDPNDALKVRRFAISPDDTKMIATGTFTSVNGVARRQIFEADLIPWLGMSLSTWHSKRFDKACAPATPLWSRGVDFSPDGSYFVVTATGDAPVDRDTQLCSSASRWEVTDQSASSQPTWINWTGGDSLYAVAIDDAAVYVGGHQRWLDNPEGDDSAGPGAVSRPGIGALDPGSGRALGWNPTKDRNHGTEKLLLTPTALWVGSDGNVVGKEYHPGIAAFPRS